MIFPDPPGINSALTNPQNGGLNTSFLGFYKKSGFLFSEPDLLIRKQIKYLDPCHHLRNTLLRRHVNVSARFMAPKKQFFVFCSATLNIQASSGLCLFLESFRKCSEVFKMFDLLLPIPQQNDFTSPTRFAAKF